MQQTSLELTPLSGTMGVEISGIDLSAGLDEATAAELRAALVEHHVIVFRDQELTPEQQMAVGAAFGELDTHPFVEGRRDYPEVLEVITEPDDILNFGGVSGGPASSGPRPASTTSARGATRLAISASPNSRSKPKTFR